MSIAEPEAPDSMASLVSIRQQALHEVVVERVQQMITEGLLAPGTRLNERMLCERLGVSRTPLREAFMVLAARGLVTLLPNRGTVVRELSREQIAQTFEVISGLESMSGELACERIEAGELDELRALHFEMMACHARRDLPGYYRLNQAIHAGINRASRNDVLIQTYSTINSRLQALRFRSNFRQDKWDAAMQEHCAMIDALDARDGPRLGSILRQHVLVKSEAVLAERDAEAAKLA